MLWSLSDKTRMFYQEFEVFDFKTFIKNYFMLFLRIFSNSLSHRMFGRYFLGAIALNNHKDAVGFARLYIKSYGFFKSATYGIVVRDDYQSKGLGKVLTSHIINYAKALNLNKITLTVLTSNERAIELYKKFGFVIEGLHKQNYVSRNSVSDVYTMALFLSQRASEVT